MVLSRQFNQIPYASSDRRRAQRDPRMPSDSALRRIVDEDPTETPASIAEYYDVRPEVVRRALRRLSIRLQSPQRDRKLPDDDTLRQLLEDAAQTGFAPIMQAYGVSAAACSKAKRRLGVQWERKGNAVIWKSGRRIVRGKQLELMSARVVRSMPPPRPPKRRPSPRPVMARGEQLELALF